MPEGLKVRLPLATDLPETIGGRTASEAVIKSFCDSCSREIGVVQAGRQDTRSRGHHRSSSVLLAEGGLVLDVQLHVVPPDGQHVCQSCAKRALERAWTEAPTEIEGVPPESDGAPPEPLDLGQRHA